MTTIDEHKKRVQALIKKIQVVAFIVAAIIVVVVVFSSLPKEKISEEEQLTPLVSEKIVFTPPLELTDAIEGVSYSYSFCRPESARSGATCGGLAGATENPYGGKPPYSFSHQFGVGFIPTGLALELNGLLRGTPTLPGDYAFGVCVTDLYEEVCKTTSLTVNPKSGQLEEQLEEQPEEQIEEQPEQVFPSVKIESASVTFKKRDFLDPDQYLCRVKMSGTATLPVKEGMNLQFSGCFDNDIERYGGDCRFEIAGENIANFVGSTVTCPSWTQHYGSSDCDRPSGQPATGEWSLTFGDWFYPWRGHKKTYFVSVGREVWDSVTLTCSP